MKQHPIPQNILDIEFKLFSKFTVREFVYIAAGIGVGGIFLYLFADGSLPGMIGIPLFIFFSGVGLFMGLVPINDQKADVYVKNFIKAITQPTLRIWKSKYYEAPPGNRRPTGNKPQSVSQQTTRGSVNRAPVTPPKSKIIGASDKKTTKSNQPQTQADIQEQKKLAQIKEIAQSTGDPAADKITEPQQDPQPQTAQPSVQNSTQTAPPTPQSQVHRQPAPHLQSQPEPTPSDTINAKSIPPAQAQQNQPAKSTPTGTTPNTITLKLLDSNGNPLPKAVAIIKDPNGNTILTGISNENGIVSSNKTVPAGVYSTKIEHGTYSFPKVDYIVKDGPNPVMTVKSTGVEDT
ncbi:hypothetical protein GF357_01225 [Candidatus Dojkabacteria bacterium]|nr:hypothetical protein [Candidatus Dojkabacteria bacterium]